MIGDILVYGIRYNMVCHNIYNFSSSLSQNNKINFQIFFISRYCKSIGGVYQKAESCWKNKDDENAYILFMRCFNTYQAIIKSYEFSKAKVC